MSSRLGRQLFPPLAGILMALVIFAGFNAPILMNKASYWLKTSRVNAQATSEVHTEISNNVKADPSKPSSIFIDKISVSAPIIYSEKEINEKSFQLALRNGVVHFPETALPGQNGNVVIFGHSSGAWWVPGNYKHVFTLLDKLSVNDIVTIEYQGITYKYKIKNTRIVMPTEVSVLNQTNFPTLTLITCYPVGTNEKRLIVEAEQISPTTGFQSGKEIIKSPSAVKLPSSLPWQSPSLNAPWENF